MVELARAVDHFWDRYLEGDGDELSLLATGLVRCRNGHSLAPPCTDCGCDECIMILLGGGGEQS